MLWTSVCSWLKLKQNIDCGLRDATNALKYCINQDKEIIYSLYFDDFGQSIASKHL